MRITTQLTEHAGVVLVEGEVDVYTAGELDQALQAQLAQTPVVVVDLTEVSFMDSTGLGVLMKGLKTARSREGAVRLVVTTTRIRRLFEITGLDASLPMFDTRDQALEG